MNNTGEHLDRGGLLHVLQTAQRNVAWAVLHTRAGRRQFAESVLIAAQVALAQAEGLAAPRADEEEDDGECKPAKKRKTGKKTAACEAAAQDDDGTTNEIVQRHHGQRKG